MYISKLNIEPACEYARYFIWLVTYSLWNFEALDLYVPDAKFIHKSTKTVSGR